MTALDNIRAIALLLPEAEEQAGDGGTTFVVGGKCFVEYRDADRTVRTRTSLPAEQAHTDDAAGKSDAMDAGGPQWLAMGLDGDVDWVLVEDRVARSWELTAPGHLLEAGGR